MGGAGTCRTGMPMERGYTRRKLPDAQPQECCPAQRGCRRRLRLKLVRLPADAWPVGYRLV